MSHGVDSDRSDAWQQEVKALENEGREAFLARDLVRLNELWADDLLVNSPINRIHTKQQVLDLLGKGVIAHVLYEQEIELLQRHEDVVVVMGSDRVSNDGSVVLRRRYTNLWRLEEGAWRLFAMHANIVSGA